MKSTRYTPDDSHAWVSSEIEQRLKMCCPSRKRIFNFRRPTRHKIIRVKISYKRLSNNNNEKLNLSLLKFQRDKLYTHTHTQTFIFFRRSNSSERDVVKVNTPFRKYDASTSSVEVLGNCAVHTTHNNSRLVLMKMSSSYRDFFFFFNGLQKTKKKNLMAPDQGRA